MILNAFPFLFVHITVQDTLFFFFFFKVTCRSGANTILRITYFSQS